MRLFSGGYLTCSSYRDLSRNRKSSNHRGQSIKAKEPSDPRGPFYYVGGANGAKIVISYCEDQGWQRLHDQHRHDYQLKWCEAKSRATYLHFREGQQLLYQIPNNTLLTTKIGLLSSLRDYERVSAKVNAPRLRRLKMEQFFPDTFRLDVREERELFFAQQNGVEGGEPGGCVWICKPSGMNQGRGIFLLKTPGDVADLRLRLEQQESSRSHGGRRAHVRPPQAYIAQRYVNNPLLLEGKKFDVRSYLLIACTDPYVVLFRHGYARLTCEPYDPRSDNLTAHLTNQCMQKKNPLYSLLKEDTVWSMEKLNDYVNDRYSVAKALPRDWITGDFARFMQRVVVQCFSAVKSKLDRKLGLFDLIGCDFLIDEEFKVWLLEMNCNPALHTNCGVLQDVVPRMLVETLDLTLEIFSKRLCGQPILPLASQRDFVLLYSAAAPLTCTSPPGGKRRTSRGVQRVLRGTSPQNTTTTTTTTPTRKHDPAPHHRRSLGNPNRAVTSHVSGKVSEEIGKDDTSNSKATKRELAPGGRPETLSRRASALPLKSPKPRVKPRLKKCSWPPAERSDRPKKLSISGGDQQRKRASATSPPTTRRLSEGTGGSPEERPGGSLTQHRQ
ncbi:hypothetical protein NHX12_010550 [Muraenolepis orangiensis]|uniref:Tubulin tyrosine ligase-like family, member 10 n=1 Tax=Muraenolepis orangiensis TaxID=630683 RepID=A0A9Q0I7D9_9TELE|nr:hypothetical protein NHX12_010550 [Muraenolepis orangiensis]